MSRRKLSQVMFAGAKPFPGRRNQWLAAMETMPFVDDPRIVCTVVMAFGLKRGVKVKPGEPIDFEKQVNIIHWLTNKPPTLQTAEEIGRRYVPMRWSTSEEGVKELNKVNQNRGSGASMIHRSLAKQHTILMLAIAQYIRVGRGYDLDLENPYLKYALNEL